MRRRRLGVLLVGLALASGVSACGGSDVVVDSVPRSTPELTAPPDTGLGAATTPSASTTTTPTDTTATAPAAPSTGGATPTQTPATPQTGGATPQTPATPQTTTPSTGGASPGAFSEFCKQNPGACGQ